MAESETISDFPGGFVHRPAHPTGDGILLTHGAGSNCRSPLLVGLAEAFARIGLWVLRYDLPFRQRRPFGPPGRADGAADRAGLRSAVERLRSIATGRLILAGHSYGGRQASLLAVEDGTAADSLLLLSYPLHPPNKPAELRTSHFPQWRTRALFVHGTNDPFGSVDELVTAVRLIPAETQIQAIEKAGHDLWKGTTGIAAEVTRGVSGFLLP
jgi:uncharacterized protein